MFNISRRGAVDNGLTSHAQGPGFDLAEESVFPSFLVVLFCFVFFSF